MSASEISCKIFRISTHIENQRKCVYDIERTADDSASAIGDDDKDTNILGDSN